LSLSLSPFNLLADLGTDPFVKPPPLGKAAKNKKKKLRKKKQGGGGQPQRTPIPQAADNADAESYKSGSGTECSDSDFEGNAGYRRGGYHPVHIGEVYNGRYTVLKKLGWGHFSTVWYSLDSRTGKHVALKVQKSADNYTDAAYDEIELLRTAQLKAEEADASLTLEWRSEQRHAVEELQAFEESGAPPPEEGSPEDDRLQQLRDFLRLPQPHFESHVVGLVDHFIHVGPHGKREWRSLPWLALL
jgi:hypothetical protein